MRSQSTLSLKRLTAVLAFALTLGLFITGCDDGPTSPEMQSESAPKVSTNHEAKPSGPVPIELAWGDGELWELLSPHAPTPAAEPSHRPLYVVAPADDEHSPQAEGHGGPIKEHDHVVPIPPQNGGSYSAMWHVINVVDANKVPLDGPPTSDDLYGPATSVEEVEQAVKDGAAVLLETDFVFTCPIRPHNGK